MMVMSGTVQRWAISAFAVVGAFMLCSFCGAGIARLLGFWDLPVIGFFAAFGVVSTSYLSAPNRNKQYAVVIFILGAILAWLLLGNAVYPEAYASNAYQGTKLPFLITFVGGILPLAVIFAPYSSQ
jgi:hypothetical protein